MIRWPRRRLQRGGFTLVEILAVTALIGILARLAVPRYTEFRRRAEAVALVSDLYTIRSAAFHYNADTQLWPLNTAAGTTPKVLKSYLPGSITFKPSSKVSYVWLARGMPGGDPTRAASNALLGIGITTTDAAMRAQVMKALSGAPSYTSGQDVYLLIWGPGLRP
jgi:prepilin-type N-terminal cleavage/methylation domain-containing protein